MPSSPLYVAIWGAVMYDFSAQVTRLSAATPEHLHLKKLPEAATSVFRPDADHKDFELDAIRCKIWESLRERKYTLHVGGE